jgi:hypothetical protein
LLASLFAAMSIPLWVAQYAGSSALLINFLFFTVLMDNPDEEFLMNYWQ